MKNVQKGFGLPLIFIVVALVAVAGGGVYLYLQHQQQQTDLQNAENNLTIAAQHAQAQLAKENQVIAQSTQVYQAASKQPATPAQAPKTDMVSDSLGLYTIQLPANWTQISPIPGEAESFGVGVQYAASADNPSSNVVVIIDAFPRSLFESNFSPQAKGVTYMASHSQNFSYAATIVQGAQEAYLEQFELNQKHFTINAYGKTHSYSISGSWTNANDASKIKAIVESIILTDR